MAVATGPYPRRRVRTVSIEQHFAEERKKHTRNHDFSVRMIATAGFFLLLAGLDFGPEEFRFAVPTYSLSGMAISLSRNSFATMPAMAQAVVTLVQFAVPAALFMTALLGHLRYTWAFVLGAIVFVVDASPALAMAALKPQQFSMANVTIVVLGVNLYALLTGMYACWQLNKLDDELASYAEPDDDDW